MEFGALVRHVFYTIVLYLSFTSFKFFRTSKTFNLLEYITRVSGASLCYYFNTNGAKERQKRREKNGHPAGNQARHRGCGPCNAGCFLASGLVRRRRCGRIGCIPSL